MLLRKNIKVEDDGQTIYAPVSGSVIPIEDVHDEVFCQKMMGDGLAIEPTEGKLYAPVSGIITVVFPTKHVIAITSMEGIDVIIHVGIDTVELKGTYFHPYVKVGDKVKAGDMLMSIDLKNIKTIAKTLSNARRVKILGKNRTGLSALQFRYRLTKIGFDAEAITDGILMNQMQESLTKGDVVLIFTTRAEDLQYYELIRNISKNGATTIVVTCTETKLIKQSNYHILLPSIENASTSSFLDNQTIMFVFIEILLAELAYKVNGNYNHELKNQVK